MTNKDNFKSSTKCTIGIISSEFLTKMENAMEEMDFDINDNHYIENKSRLINQSFTYQLSQKEIALKSMNINIKINNGIQHQIILDL